MARNVVLTAAHCKGGNYNVVVGKHKLSNGGGQTVRKKLEVPHPVSIYIATKYYSSMSIHIFFDCSHQMLYVF